MAITTTTISKNAGWARTDIIYQLESAFAWLGWHGDTRTGIVTGIQSRSGGNGGSGGQYWEVPVATTSGIGTGATFYVEKSGTSLPSKIMVNRPGYGYTSGEYVTLDVSSLGPTITGIGLTLLVSTISFGSTSTFYDKGVDAGSTWPWGCLRHVIQPGKKFGETYRAFQVQGNNTKLRFHVGSSFQPHNNLQDHSETSDLKAGRGNAFRGTRYHDMPFNFTDGIYLNQNADDSDRYSQGLEITTASSSSYQLDLNIFRSGIDPRFVVFSYKQPTLSSTHLASNTFGTFILHNFTTNLWDLDNLFLGGVTHIFSTQETYNHPPGIVFRTYCAGQHYTYYNRYPSKRSAEFGYIADNPAQSYSHMTPYRENRIYSNSYPTSGYPEHAGIYLRNSTAERSSGDVIGNTGNLPSSTNFNAVIKGIPLNGLLIPVPYYIPDDFVLIDFDYPTPLANIQQGDTITISGSEVYTVITGSYNQTTRTRGILFCGRKV